jgi:(R,R)-butanediol dehydrogenase/meso-butanediol dehydrogenase/diacetyl reductase
MRAVRWHGRHDVRLDDVPEPPAPGPGEILIDVAWCGICGTDIEEYTHGPRVIPTNPHPLTGCSAPLTLGHEVAGRVAAAGPGVRQPAEGDLVALDGYIFCAECAACRRHEVNRCERWGQIGLSAPGGPAQRLLAPAATAIPGPPGLPTDHLALAEPFAVAVRAVSRGGVGPDDRVAVLGAGTIGLAVLQVARAVGCASAAVAEPHPPRRDLAARLGASAVAGTVTGLLDGGPAGRFDVLIDCTDSGDVPGQALGLLRPGGRLVLVGVSSSAGAIDLRTVVLRELDLIGTVGHVYDTDTRLAVELLADHRVDAAPLISHRLPLARAVPDGFDYLAGPGRADALKILISPSGS